MVSLCCLITVCTSTITSTARFTVGCATWPPTRTATLRMPRGQGLPTIPVQATASLPSPNRRLPWARSSTTEGTSAACSPCTQPLVALNPCSNERATQKHREPRTQVYAPQSQDIGVIFFSWRPAATTVRPGASSYAVVYDFI